MIFSYLYEVQVFDRFSCMKKIVWKCFPSKREKKTILPKTIEFATWHHLIYEVLNYFSPNTFPFLVFNNFVRSAAQLSRSCLIFPMWPTFAMTLDKINKFHARIWNYDNYVLKKIKNYKKNHTTDKAEWTNNNKCSLLCWIKKSSF